MPIAETTRHLALLRGVNVGGNNILPMSALRELSEAAGCRDVATYIQSGNVVFSRDAGTAGLAARITQDIETNFGIRTPVMLRQADELRAAMQANPFLAEGIDPDKLFLIFLAELPTQDRVNALDPNRSPPDRFVVFGREIYAQFPNGTARSKLTTAYFDSKLGTISTARNWRTVSRLLEMMTGA